MVNPHPRKSTRDAAPEKPSGAGRVRHASYRDTGEARHARKISENVPSVPDFPPLYGTISISAFALAASTAA